MQSLQSKSDKNLIADTCELARRRATTTAQMIRHIAEVDSRRLHLKYACSSLFAFCTQKLNLSEAVAQRCSQVARHASRHGLLMDALTDGSIHLAGASVMAPHLQCGDAAALVDACRRKSKRQIEDIVAACSCSKPSVVRRRSSIRRVPGPAPAVSTKPSSQMPSLFDRPPQKQAQNICPGAETKAPVLPAATQSACYKLTAELSERGSNLLAEAKQLLGNQVCGDNLGAVIEKALEVLVQTEKKRRFGIGAKPRKRKATATKPRTIPASVRREVYERDDGQCTFAGVDGTRCTEKVTQFEHIKPVAQGGTSTADNITLLCPAHNQHQADVVFGRAHMEQCRKKETRGHDHSSAAPKHPASSVATTRAPK